MTCTASPSRNFFTSFLALASIVKNVSLDHHTGAQTSWNDLSGWGRPGCMVKGPIHGQHCHVDSVHSSRTACLLTSTATRVSTTPTGVPTVTVPRG